MTADKTSIEMALDCSKKMQQTMLEMSYVFTCNLDVDNAAIFVECATRLNDVVSSLEKDLKKTKTYKPKKQ